MTWRDALGLALLLLSALALVPAAVLLLQLLAAAWRGDAWTAAQPRPARAGTLAVLMPAHDEAGGIEPAIRAVLAQLAARRSTAGRRRQLQRCHRGGGPRRRRRGDRAPGQRPPRQRLCARPWRALARAGAAGRGRDPRRRLHRRAGSAAAPRRHQPGDRPAGAGPLPDASAAGRTAGDADRRLRLDRQEQAAAARRRGARRAVPADGHGHGLSLADAARCAARQRPPGRGHAARPRPRPRRHAAAVLPGGGRQQRLPARSRGGAHAAHALGARPSVDARRRRPAPVGARPGARPAGADGDGARPDGAAARRPGAAARRTGARRCGVVALGRRPGAVHRRLRRPAARRRGGAGGVVARRPAADRRCASCSACRSTSPPSCRCTCACSASARSNG